MKIYKISSKRVIAYHGTDKLFKEFDPSLSFYGVFWFKDNIEEIKNGSSGAASIKYILKCELDVDKTAGWEEYDKYYLEQIEDMGYDSIKLDSDWIIFDKNRIKILGIEKSN